LAGEGHVGDKFIPDDGFSPNEDGYLIEGIEIHFRETPQSPVREVH
jgi:hypothetical protein